mgnify:CR=1 FL=1
MARLGAETGARSRGKRLIVALLLARCARALRPAARRVVARPGRLASVAASRAELIAPAQTTQQSVPVYSNEEVQAAPELPIAYDDVVIVNDVSKARAVADRLASASDRYHAVDTEVDGIDLSREGPVGNGVVTCFTVYSGPDFSYDGVNKGKALFVDTTVPSHLEAFSQVRYLCRKGRPRCHDPA